MQEADETHMERICGKKTVAWGRMGSRSGTWSNKLKEAVIVDIVVGNNDDSDNRERVDRVQRASGKEVEGEAGRKESLCA